MVKKLSVRTKARSQNNRYCLIIYQVKVSPQKAEPESAIEKDVSCSAEEQQKRAAPSNCAKGIHSDVSPEDEISWLLTLK